MSLQKPPPSQDLSEVFALIEITKTSIEALIRESEERVMTELKLKANKESVANALHRKANKLDVQKIENLTVEKGKSI